MGENVILEASLARGTNHSIDAALHVVDGCQITCHMDHSGKYEVQNKWSRNNAVKKP